MLGPLQLWTFSPLHSSTCLCVIGFEMLFAYIDGDDFHSRTDKGTKGISLALGVGVGIGNTSYKVYV